MSEEKRLMMSEEEVRQRIKELLTLPKEDLIIQHLFIEQENQKYKEVIDKAIEFIEWFRKDNMEFYKNKGVALTISECDGLLKILKGDSNE